ncbi:ArgS-related anticodon-binding protein NrtL [Streptomyces sp. NPDC000229]|uniref:ArgS-related anticodon-binding protein NrtL n=1 Tax=Streptomyces sp. NPDC000229 TaxID=3154247 RepID=UPI00332DC8BF
MTPADLSLTVLHAVRRAVGEGALRAQTRVPERVVVERPRPGGRGDWATNAALQLARDAGMEPLGVAQVLGSRIAEADGIECVEITGPGFLNITLADRGRRALVRDILDARERYGHGTSLAGRAFRLSHRGDVRAAVMADAVRGLLEAQGAVVDQTEPAALPDRPGAQVRDAAEPADVRDDAEPAALPDRPGAQVRDHAEPAALRDGADDTAETLTLRPLPVTYDVHALGPDAARWALLRPAAHDRALGPDGLLVQSEANPLFTVRYAHARARALLRNAVRFDMSPAYEEDVDAPRLLAALGDYPAVLEAAARHCAPDRVARHLEATADAFLGFQHTVLPLGDEKPSAAHRSRLALAEAAGTVLAGGLALLGISAPDYL